MQKYFADQGVIFDVQKCTVEGRGDYCEFLEGYR